MLKRIYEELVLIRKELQAIHSSKELNRGVTVGRAPYGRSYRVLPKQHCTGKEVM